MPNNIYASDRTGALHFLKDHPIGVLATLGAENVPELSTIYFFIQSDFLCYFVTKTETRKYHNFLAKQKATLLAYDEEKLATVEMSGEVETVTDIVKATEIIESFQDLVLSRKVGYWVPPIAQLERGNYAVCRLVPATVRFHQFASPQGDDKPDLFIFNAAQ
jgi:uncharacterized pyridoxamine 5'-phosphate oxidase family protein